MMFQPNERQWIVIALLVIAPTLQFLSVTTFAQDSDAASRLLQAQSIRCVWGTGTQGSWQDGEPLLEQGTFGDDATATVTYDSIDTENGSARVIGNAGAYDVVAIPMPVGLTFIEQGSEVISGLSVTTVFTRTVERDALSIAERAQGRVDDSFYVAVISRHLNILGSIAPSQWHGTCRILQ